ncbi:MAG: gliding motility-associated C-terminal domain-containing protein [Bacteroidia bacterium]
MPVHKIQRSLFLSILILVVSFFSAKNAHAQTLTKGMDAVVTLYGMNESARVADIKRVGDQNSAPHNSNWVLPFNPLLTTWTAGRLGQIYGTAIDDAGNVYFATTAMYVETVSVGANGPLRLGKPTCTTSPAGGVGYHVSGGPAGIYKASASSLNTVAPLTTTLMATSGGGVGTTTIPNTGYGIGNIAYAKFPVDRLYASNLEDGKIYCIDPTSGVIMDVYDPFSSDPGAADIADYGERIFGLAVNYEAGETRLYYAVLINSTHSEIWSVRLGAGGVFTPGTNSLEIQLPQASTYSYVADLAFSFRGELLVGEKSGPHSANVYQYFGKHNAWSLPQKLFMSSYSPNANSGGGVDYGYSRYELDTTRFYCDTLIWTQSNAITPNGGTGSFLAYGLLSHPLAGYSNNASYLNEAYMVNLRGDVTSQYLTPKGSFGDVECFDWTCDPDQTDICGKTDARLVPSAVGNCCYNIELLNHYRPDYFRSISITSSALNISNITKDPNNNWANITYTSPTEVVFTRRLGYFDGLPFDSSNGYQVLGTVCFTGSGTDSLTINFIGNPPQSDTVCRKKLGISGCTAPVDTSCVGILDLETECIDGTVKMKFRIQNNSNFTVRGITIHSQTPGVLPLPKFLPVADILPGQSSPYYEVPLLISGNDSNACFFFSACDQNTTPGIGGPYPFWCCMDSILYCVNVPRCDACESISFTATQTDPAKCCYSISLLNGYNQANIEFLEFEGLGGTQFALFTGWNIVPPVGSSKVRIKAPGGDLSPGNYPNFGSFCLSGTSVPPHTIIIKSFDTRGVLLCIDTLNFQGCELVEPTCATIVNDSLYCDGTKTKFTFFVKNNSPFVIHQFDLRTAGGFSIDQAFIQPNPPIPKGGTGGPYTVTLDSIDKNLDQFCVYLSAHNSVYDPEKDLYATECCTDSAATICLPMPKCDVCETDTCCGFASLIIPNGITPNGDGINDKLIIPNSGCCAYISLVVFNRWGNVVYETKDYKNDWEGMNLHGDKLSQGTYFILFTLPGGAQQGQYIDIRY